MNIAISDTTALIILAKSDKLELLTNLFEKIFIPQAVQNELNIKDDVVKYRIEHFDKISLKAVTDITTLNRIKRFNIDKGETEAIALALELDMKLIIDERKGRTIAISQGLKVVGALGILIENYKQNYTSFEETHYFFKLFKKNGLRISEALEKIFIERLRELKS